MTEQDLRQAIIVHYRRLAENGLNHGTTGNISVRHADGLLLTPTGMSCETLVPEDIVFMRADGHCDGPRLPTSEWRFHRDILAERPDLHAVVHTHAPYCTALSIRRMTIPPLHYMIAKAGGYSIRCSDYATFGTAELSCAALAALEGRRACLLANHGMIACGETLAGAAALAVEIEALAQQYVLALQLGGPVLLDEAEIARVSARFCDYGQPADSAGGEQALD